MSSDVAFRLLEWEREIDALAPLSDKQKLSIEEIALVTADRPIPSHLPLGHGVHSLAPTSTNKNGEGVKLEEVGLPKNLHEFFEKKPSLSNSYQFYSFLSCIEESLIQENEEQYLSFMNMVKEYSIQCSKIVEEVVETLNELELLQKQYELVSTKTTALHNACEALLAEQAKLVNSAESISEKLSNFLEVDRISQKLNSPTLSVMSESFGPMLKRLDECIAFLSSNPQYRDSKAYLVKFRHCMFKALNLVSAYVIKTLQNATQQVLPKDSAPTSQDDAFTVFYGKFRVNAPKVKALMEQIEMRAEPGNEYYQMLSDCYQCYLSQRESLLMPSVTATINDLATNFKRDHCTLVRNGCAFLLRVCEDENQLFYQFFTIYSPHLNYFLEKMCLKLYDVLRPLIIHINHLETLSELCSIMKMEMLEEHLHSEGRIAPFEMVITQMLQDVQERLVYRSHIYIRTDILGYRPAPGDLAYPEKLEMMESIAESIMQQRHRRSDSVDSSTSAASITSQEVASITSGRDEMTKSLRNSPADLHGMWYPTVRRTLVCLSKLYRCIDKSIFQGLSQEALAMCIQSLISASDSITKNQTSLDSHLFQIKHLLILREQITPFQVDFAIKEMSLDFSKVKDAAFGLLNKKAKIFSISSNNALLEFVLHGTPQVTENCVDSKKDVDAQLKLVCTKFIDQSTDLLILPLRIFIEKANVIIKINIEEPQRDVKLSNQPFATVELVAAVVTEASRLIKLKLPGLLRSLSLYLASKETESILLRPIKKKVQESFEQLSLMVKNNYNEEDQRIIACLSAEQVNGLFPRS